MITRLALALVLSLAFEGTTGCGSSSSTAPLTAHSSARQSAEDLASLQEGAPPEASDPLVASIERGTIALIPYCKTSPVAIDSIANAALEDLKNHGIKDSAPHVLSELLAFYTHADSATGKTTCSQASAVYLTLREQPGGSG
jgi:hypothetical protein